MDGGAWKAAVHGVAKSWTWLSDFTFTFHFHALEEMATHSSVLAWRIPWTEEPGRLQSMGSLRVGHDWATSLSLFTCMHWRRNGNPLQCFCLENPRDKGAWWAAVYGVTQSRTRLKWLSSSSSMDLTFQVPIQYCSLQHQTLLLSPVTSTTRYCFCFGSITSFFLELFLHWPPVAYWAPTNL